MLGQNNTIAVYRLSTSGGHSSYELILSGIVGYLEQVKPTKNEFLDENNAFLTYKFYCSGILDVKAKDKIIDKDGNDYYVYGFMKYPNIDIPEHTEVFLTKK